MPINDPKHLFVRMLSDLRRGAERSTKIAAPPVPLATFIAVLLGEWV